MRRSEIAGALVFFLLGMYVVQQSTLLDYSAKFGPGSGFLPFWLGWAFIALALFHFANIMFQPKLYPGKQPFPGGKGAVRVVAVYLVLLGTIFVMGRLGLLIALGAMGAALLIGVERRPWAVSLATAVAISVSVYVLFAVVLRVPFPRSPLGI